MQLFVSNVQRNKKDHALTYLWHQKTCRYIFFTNRLWNTKKIKRTHVNLWHQNVWTHSLKMLCKIQRSNSLKKITLFIFDIKNVRTYSSNIKLKRYKVSFSLLANYLIMMPPHVCIETFVWLSSCCACFL